MNVEPLREITEDEIRRWEEDGVIHLRGLFDQDWVKRMQDAVEDVLANPGPLGSDLNDGKTVGRFAIDTFMWQRHPDFRAFAFDSPSPRLAASFMRAKKVNLLFDGMLSKAPHTPMRTTFHQDLPGMHADGKCSGMWFSLDHVTAESGAVQWVRGSHRWNKYYKAKGSGDPKRSKVYDGYNQRSEDEDAEEMPDILSNMSAYDIVSFDTEPGDCIITHLLLCHGGHGNTTDRKRRAITHRYASEDAYFVDRSKVLYSMKLASESGLKPGERFPDDPAHHIFPRVIPRANGLSPAR